LVFSTTGIGDCLFDSAAIKSLKKGYPHAKLVVCTHHRRPAIVEHNPFVDQVIRLSKSPISQLRLLAHFWKKRPDLIVALRVNEDAVPLGYLLNRHAFVGAVERCQRLSFLLSHPVITTQPGKKHHIIEETLKVALVAGGSPTNCGMIYKIQERELLALHTKYPLFVQKKYIVFQTGGGRTFSWRDWPVASYIQAIHWLQQEYDYSIILTGGADNRAAATAIVAGCPGVFNYTEKTTLEETAALLSGAVMLVSTDTGVMHLGIAIGCPTLAILHYRSPASFCGPLEDNLHKHEVVELVRPEHPIQNPSINEMSLIPFEKVKAAIERILGNAEKSS
jgi:ADP-heptose:LPS heptosyltransferase